MPIIFFSEAYFGLFFWLDVLKSQNQDPKLKVPPGGKKSIDLSRIWTRESWISRRVRYPETTEADLIKVPLRKKDSIFFSSGQATEYLILSLLASVVEYATFKELLATIKDICFYLTRVFHFCKWVLEIFRSSRGWKDFIRNFLNSLTSLFGCSSCGDVFFLSFPIDLPYLQFYLFFYQSI